MKRLKSFCRNMSFLCQLRLVLGAIILILTLVFLYLKIVPGGQITYTRNWPRGLVSGKGFIYDFKPAERLVAVDSAALRLVAEPVYFSLYSPRGFDKAELTVKYRDHLASATPIIEVGVLRDKLTGQYEFKPLQNDLVDKYRFSLPRLEDSPERLILQTEKYYDDVAEFEKDLQSGNLKDCPGGPTTCVASYNYPLDFAFRLPDYTAIAPALITQPFRGAQQFYVYFPAGAWRLAFDFVDLNFDKGQDPITVNVYSGAQIAATQALTDNNPTPDNGQSEEKEVILNGQGVSGLYRVEIKVSDDIVMAQLNSSSDKIAFINKIWPVSGKGATLFTDASSLGVATINPASLGKISFGGKKFDINQTYKQFYFSASAGVNKVILAKDDLVLENSGVFSFSAASLINPGVKKIDRYFSLTDNIKYLMAAYERPLEDNGLKTARAVLSLKGAAVENNKYTFLFSIPGLDGTADSENYLEIEEISIKLTGKNILEKAGEFLSRILRK